MRSVLLVTLLCSSAVAQYNAADTLNAIRRVEPGGQPNQGIGARGDNGNAIGPFQIWKIYHTDAAERDKSLTDYKRCSGSLDYSQRVVRAYMRRYAGASWKRLEGNLGTIQDVERVARIHNGGPRGCRKTATLGYWRKVLRFISRKSQ